MKKKLLIHGMSCGHCVNHLATALTEDIDGIEVIEISLENKFAIINMSEKVLEKDLKDLIEELGFELKEIQQ
ncbi:MAG: heavy-metal-associated domain-containing protein [Romboutsia sp.]